MFISSVSLYNFYGEIKMEKFYKLEKSFVIFRSGSICDPNVRLPLLLTMDVLWVHYLKTPLVYFESKWYDHYIRVRIEYCDKGY